MTLSRFRAPSSRCASSKKRKSTRSLSILLAGLALSSATLNTARDLPSTSIDEFTCVVSVPPGLTRKRGAFRKAIEILTDGAGANERLANYLDDLTMRVKGVAPSGDNNSGIAALKHASGIRIRRTDATAAKTGSGRAEAAAAYAASSAASVASSSYSENQLAANPHFTVGDMAFEINPAIEHWMSYYTSNTIGRNTMKIGIARSNTYLEMARAEFRSAGVPEDLVWLAFVESVWNPRAVSPAAAGGIWQFIPATATDYGLRVQAGDDERADPYKQTRVAATYLHDLYTIFGDWALVMAAYNSGEPRVMGAIVKNGRANFWDLYEKELLPRETRDYVPKILAAIKVASQPDSYGLAPQTALASLSGS